jgi:hypothetical protein
MQEEIIKAVKMEYGQKHTLYIKNINEVIKVDGKLS